MEKVDHRGTSQTCPNCRITVRKELSDRIHFCPECQYEVNRDIASAQEICNRGLETYPGTLEKQEIGSQVEVSGAMCLDNWRRGECLIVRLGSPQHNLGFAVGGCHDNEYITRLSYSLET